MTRTTEEIAQIMSSWWAQRLDDQHAKKRAAFQKDLKRRIIDNLGDDHLGKYLIIENDYDPKGLLLEAIRATIDTECSGYMFSGDGIFPTKHSLALMPSGEIEPKEGYGNWTKPL